MKSKVVLQALLGITLLAACGPQIQAPLAQGPVPGLQANRALTAQGAASNSLLMTDNFTRYMAARNQGEEWGMEPVPLEGQAVQQLPKVGQKALTYMTYEALDNNLFNDLNRILDTLELVGSNSQMNLVAQIDNLHEGNAARYYLTQNATFPGIASPYVPLGAAGENSGDPNVFANAVRWGFASYPSRMKWLNISTHGMGFAGINYDDSPQQSMNIMQFANAVKAGLGGQKLNILSFDACLMATVEVASEVKDVTNILVGSEDSTYYWGYGYYQTFAKIAGNPAAMNPDQVARSMVVDVNNKGAGNQTLTISATDVRKIGLLEAELDKLARALRQAMPQHKAGIVRAMKATKEFHMAEGIPFRDINRMVALLKQNVKDPSIAAICDQINHVMYRRGVIMFNRANRIENGQGRGLSIYLPTDGNVSALYRQTRFARSTQWDEFLLDLNRAITQG